LPNAVCHTAFGRNIYNDIFKIDEYYAHPNIHITKLAKKLTKHGINYLKPFRQRTILISFENLARTYSISARYQSIDDKLQPVRLSHNGIAMSQKHNKESNRSFAHIRKVRTSDFAHNIGHCQHKKMPQFTFLFIFVAALSDCAAIRNPRWPLNNLNSICPRTYVFACFWQ